LTWAQHHAARTRRPRFRIHLGRYHGDPTSFPATGGRIKEEQGRVAAPRSCVRGQPDGACPAASKAGLHGKWLNRTDRWRRRGALPAEATCMGGLPAGPVTSPPCARSSCVGVLSVTAACTPIEMQQKHWGTRRAAPVHAAAHADDLGWVETDRTARSYGIGPRALLVGTPIGMVTTSCHRPGTPWTGRRERPPETRPPVRL